ncbi:MAG TPA: (d)CMP kinase, partial [Myxococcaceae bacterium]|nr:(d)CMP kinase [Myxococcaceae bacterium]
GIGYEDDPRLTDLLKALDIRFEVRGEENWVFLGDEDVSEEIRTPEISMGASKVSGRPVVRDSLLELQRRLALSAKSGAVLEGRDIGTVVFPDADAKFFLEANPEIRARRRFEELFQKGVDGSLEDVLSEQNRRDVQDSTRAVAPLKPAPDALKVDSSSMPISEVVRTLETRIAERRAQRAANRA